MELSPEREAELIEQNMPKIYRAVDNFSARNGGTRSYDDFVQEVSIVFLKHIRRCETEEQISRFPWYDSIKAMSEHVLRSQSIPAPARTAHFKEVLRSLPSTVSLDLIVTRGLDVDGMSKHWVLDKDTEMDFDAFLSEQPEDIQRIVSMRIFGLSNRKIASQYGVSGSAIDKKIMKLKEKYEDFNKGDESDE